MTFLSLKLLHSLYRYKYDPDSVFIYYTRVYKKGRYGNTHTRYTTHHPGDNCISYSSVYPQRDLLRIVDLQIFQIFKPHFCFQRPATHFIFPLIIKAYVETMPTVGENTDTIHLDAGISR